MCGRDKGKRQYAESGATAESCHICGRDERKVPSREHQGLTLHLA
jgi:hypothetical protein